MEDEGGRDLSSEGERVCGLRDDESVRVETKTFLL